MNIDSNDNMNDGINNKIKTIKVIKIKLREKLFN